MKNTYLQPDEYLIRSPSMADFPASQISASIEDSYSLVNGFLNSNLKLPAMEDDGEIPGILKICQRKLVTYLLELDHSGQSDELQSLYDSTVLTLKKITDNELLVSEIAVTQLDVGWTITENNCSTSGSIFVDGIPPIVDTVYTFTITSTGTTYVKDTTFQVVRSDSSDVYATITGTFETWTTVGSGGLKVRFDGQFTENESFIVKGVVEQSVVSSHNIIKQVQVIF